MKKIPYSLLTVLVLFGFTFTKADPIDSLVNVTTWQEANGGNGHTYAILKMTITWDSVSVIVPSLDMNGLPGYLAAITSQAENDFVLNNILNGVGPQSELANQFYLGGELQNSMWGWLTEEPFVFTNWSPGEPNNADETVISMWGYDSNFPGRLPGKWNNTLPNDNFNIYARAWSVVEWNPPVTPNSFILPNPIFAAMAHPINEFYVVIWAGDFGGGYTPSDVDQSSIIVNGNLVPAMVEITPHAIFGGDALKISVDITEFLPPYGILWNEVTQNYTVEGSFNDETPFTSAGTFTSIGHILGDVNGDGSVNVTDLSIMVNRIFRGGPEPAFPEAADVDGSCGTLNIADLTYLVSSLFHRGPAPTHCIE